MSGPEPGNLSPRRPHSRISKAVGVLVVAVMVMFALLVAGESPADPLFTGPQRPQPTRCMTSYEVVHWLQRYSRSGSRTFDRVAAREARRAEQRMTRLRFSAPDRRTARLAADLRHAFGDFAQAARRAHGRGTGKTRARRALGHYLAASSRFMRRLAHVCGGTRHRGHSRAGSAVVSEAVYAEQEGHHGVNTFTNYHNASGMGPAIAPGAWVQVSCKVYDPYIQSVNPDGYWYRIASAPWNDAYYSPANTFMNGDPWNGPYTHNTDFNVPDCGSTPAPVPAPAGTVTLGQGPAAPSGYRYAVTVDHFAANSSVSVSCRDSVSPGGFYTFSLPTDGSGHGFTQSSCYSGDGPEHWVVVNGSLESNHVIWSGGGSGAGAPPAGGGAATGGGSGGKPGSNGTGFAPCAQYHGIRIADSGTLAASLFGHYLSGHGEAVVIDWSYFRRDANFVNEAKSLRIGQSVSGWAAPSPTDMYYALGHFTIKRDNANCYSVYDHYDFDWDTAKEYVVFFPFWAIQIYGAREFDERASGFL
jgi:hypothetical protein